MKIETKQKIAKFITENANKDFCHEDYRGYKLSYVFFHVMKKAGIIKHSDSYRFIIDIARFNELGYAFIYQAYADYVSEKERNRKHVSRSSSYARQQETKPIMDAAFKQMKDVFTSYEYCQLLIKNGIDPELVRKGIAANYLKQIATQNGHRSKTWFKKTSQNKPNNDRVIIQPEPKPLFTFNSNEEIINHVKSLGFRVLKPINQWEEI